MQVDRLTAEVSGACLFSRNAIKQANLLRRSRSKMRKIGRRAARDGFRDLALS